VFRHYLTGVFLSQLLSFVPWEVDEDEPSLFNRTANSFSSSSSSVRSVGLLMSDVIPPLMLVRFTLTTNFLTITVKRTTLLKRTDLIKETRSFSREKKDSNFLKNPQC